MNNYDWYFSNLSDQQRSLSDSLTDSKFNINPFASFTREIIQNSLDAVNDNKMPVTVKFEIKQIESKLVPGIETLKRVIGKCITSTEHQDTQRKYAKALKTLKHSRITCMKISDYNTKGMTDEQFNALLNFEGKSVKNNDNQAGRHGVGKKASFLMSLCNTVLYSTKNIEGNCMFQGKVILTDWEDEGVWRSKNGWFGYNDKNRIQPIDQTLNHKIDDFFIRQDEFGTDIIIVSLRPNNNSLVGIDSEIITSVLENFFVGILESLLVVQINDVLIDKNNFPSVLNNYYKQEFTKKGTGTENVVFGLLEDYYEAYKNGNPKRIDIPEFPNQNYINLYFWSESSRSKKYYSFFRSHGMKIRDYLVSNCDKTFSAIAIAVGKEINEFLLKLENAAHDDFILDPYEDNYNLSYKRKKAIFDRIESWLRSLTKLDVYDEFDIEAINDMIDIVGDIKPKSRKNDKKPKDPKLKSIITYKSKQKTKETYIGVGSGTEVRDGKVKNNRKRKMRYDIVDPNGDNESERSASYIEIDESFLYLKNNYFLKTNLQHNLKNINIKFYAKNIDENFNSIYYALDKVEYFGKSLQFNRDGIVKIDNIEANKELKLKVSLKNDIRYKLYARIVGEKYE